MKKLVNHGGIIQYKWVISNLKELHEYLFEVAKSRISKRSSNWIRNPESDKQMKQLYHIKEVSVIQLAGVMLNDLWKSTEKYVLQGKILVFNEAGGYCFWDDETMKILDWKYLLDCKDIVVLENNSIVDEDVRNYLQNKDYLALTNLTSFTLEEIFYYCSKAKTIVFQTQAVDKQQINSLLNLALELEPKEIIIINSDRFPVNDTRLSMHNVIQIEQEYENN